MYSLRKIKNAVCILGICCLFTTCSDEEGGLTLTKKCCDSKLEVSGNYNKDSAQIFAPNIFTPDGDGLNDNFSPFVSGFEQINWKVIHNFSTAFKTNSLDGRWNGKIDGKVKSKTYRYEGTGKTALGESISFEGKVYLMDKKETFACSDCPDCKFEDQIDPRRGFVAPTAEMENLKCAN